MPNQVLVSTNASDTLENGKFRLEYFVVGSANPAQKGRFDWAPTFGDDNDELLADLLSVIQATLLARHALEILEDEVIVMGLPAIVVPEAAPSPTTIGDLRDFQFVSKAIEESLTNNETLQADNDLTLPIGAGETWEYEVIALVAAGTTGDFKWAFSWPADVTAAYPMQVSGPASNWSTGDVVEGSLRTQHILATTSGVIQGVAGGAAAVANALVVHIRLLIINGVNAGNVAFMWAQNTSNGTATIVKAGSYMKGRRIVAS